MPGGPPSRPREATPVSSPGPPPEAPPPLPVHGTWRGSLSGQVLQLALRGPADALRAEVGVGQHTEPGRGTFVPSTGAVRLAVEGRGPASGAWEWELQGDRLRGTFIPSGSQEVRSTSLVRVE